MLWIMCVGGVLCVVSYVLRCSDCCLFMGESWL